MSPERVYFVRFSLLSQGGFFVVLPIHARQVRNLSPPGLPKTFQTRAFSTLTLPFSKELHLMAFLSPAKFMFFFS